MNDIFCILNIPPQLRSKEHVDDLVKLTKDVAFFQRITVEQNSNTIHKECCKAMTLEKYRKNEIIFNIGEKGDKFYIVLTGSVSIKIPIKKKLKIKKTTAKKIQDLLEPELENSSDRDKKNPVIIKATEVLDQVNSFKVSAENEVNAKQQILDTEEKNMLNLFKNKAEKEKKILMDLIKSSDNDTIEVEFNDLKEVGVIGKGSSFGELALISDRPRSATIQANEDSSFLVLSKNDFTGILGSLAEKRLNNVINFMRQLVYFKSWSKVGLIKVGYFFQYKMFYKNQALFSEGDPVDGIYFIKQGEVVITKKHSKSLALPSVFSSSPNEFLSAIKRKSSKIVEVKIIIKGIHESVGGYEICENQEERMFNCVCVSPSCEVYYMTKNNFLTKIKNLEYIKELILEENVRIKDRYRYLREVEDEIIINKSESNTPILVKTSNKNDRYFKERSFKQLATDASSKCFSPFKKKHSFLRELTSHEVNEAINGRPRFLRKYTKTPEIDSRCYFSMKFSQQRLRKIKVKAK